MDKKDFINANSTGIKIEGHKGKWSVISSTIIENKPLYLLEHETYGDEAASLIVDQQGKVLLDDVWNGFDDYKEYLDLQLSEINKEVENKIFYLCNKNEILDYKPVYENRLIDLKKEWVNNGISEENILTFSSLDDLLKFAENKDINDFIDKVQCVAKYEEANNIPTKERLTEWWGDYAMYEPKLGITDEQICEKFYTLDLGENVIDRSSIGILNSRGKIPEGGYTDKDLVLRAVKINGYQIGYASKELLNDKEVVLEAIKNEKTAYELLSDNFKSDKDVLTLIAEDWNNLEETQKNCIMADSNFDVKKVKQITGIDLANSKNEKSFVQKACEKANQKYKNVGLQKEIKSGIEL